MNDANVKTLFGQRVRHLRTLKQWSQEHFAHVVGLDRSYVGGIERGERNVSLEKIALIAKGLGVELPELFAFHTSNTRKKRRNAAKPSR